MKTTSQNTFIVELTKEEARFIKGLVQNASVDNESAGDAQLRKDIFEGLPPFEELF